MLFILNSLHVHYHSNLSAIGLNADNLINVLSIGKHVEKGPQREGTLVQPSWHEKLLTSPHFGVDSN